jgi:hypothetical protein
MVTVVFSIPEMDHVPSDAPEVYLWFAYFWADVTTISSVVTPPMNGARSVISQFESTRIFIPSQVANFQHDLNDGGVGFMVAGVVIAMFEKHDTSDEAMEAGYEAFGPALQDQIQSFLQKKVQIFLQTKMFVAPTEQEIQNLVNAVKDAVKNAVKSKVGIDLGTQDSAVGYTYRFLAPDQLQVGEGGGIPNIIDTTDNPSKPYSQCNFPGGNVLVVATAGPDPCAKEVDAVQKANQTVTNLKDQIQNLELQLETADHLQRKVLQQEISDIKQKQLPLATTILNEAKAALAVCKTRHHPVLTGGSSTVLSKS